MGYLFFLLHSSLLLVMEGSVVHLQFDPQTIGSIRPTILITNHSKESNQRIGVRKCPLRYGCVIFGIPPPKEMAVLPLNQPQKRVSQPKKDSL